MKKLISMVDFVVNLDNNDLSESNIETIFKYAKLLKRPLSIEMFVPCKLIDDVWVVLNPPIERLQYEGGYETRYSELQEYQEAKSRCLFLDSECSYFERYKILEIKGRFEYTLKMLETRTIEYLVKYNLELTPTAQKMITNTKQY